MSDNQDWRWAGLFLCSMGGILVIDNYILAVIFFVIGCGFVAYGFNKNSGK